MQHKNFSYLKKTEDYRLVSRNSRSHKNKFFFFKISPHNITKNNYPDNKAILAITITKKIGNAVTRNKIKRRIKAIFNNFEFNQEQSNFIYSFYPHSNIINSNYSELKKEVDKIIRNVNNYII